MEFCPASSSTLSVRGHGSGEGRLIKKRKRTSSVVGTSDGKVHATSEASICDVVLDESLWNSLPEEVLELIVTRLPYAAYCRFRCVSRKWKGIQPLVPPPSCMIMCAAGDRNPKFFCDSEKKWFSLPSNAYLRSGETWEVADADAGLVCYQHRKDGVFWQLVCNPLKPSSSRLIKPTYHSWDTEEFALKTKLLVDRINNTFNIVLDPAVVGLTAVYESTSSRWTVHFAYNRITRSRFFVWENVLYTSGTKDYPEYNESLAHAFNMASRRWIPIDAELPSEYSFPKKRLFLSNNRQLLVLLYSYRKRPRPYFSIWKMQDEDSSFEQSVSLSKQTKWEKVVLASERATVDLAGHRLVYASYRGEHLCFVFRDDKIREDGSRAHKCVRYSMATESWSVIPSPGDWGDRFELYYWEPCLDVDPR